ncbi:uncharacterized protein LOC111612845 [Centruroides sculpturatus]|uniref:uncharacterized protein LOC111612845 n=1 Tax=Centruroides sculpturatus TaxID=218467 RepID=UPI000C6C936B|nr:uncharacterized protein LOC111612845 [Centruroides sculpturatus]
MAEKSREGHRIVFMGSNKQPNYIIDTFDVPTASELKEGQILVKILLATICPNDLLTIIGKGEDTTPCLLGHEGVAQVICSKRDAAECKLSPGDRVVFTATEFCPKCKMTSCHHYAKYGKAPINRCGSNGTFSTHLILEGDRDVIRISPTLPDRLVASANCALATIIGAVQPVIPAKKDAVAVIQGAGLFGIYSCAALYRGGYKVYCLDVKEERLKLVPKFGGIPILTKDNQTGDWYKEDSVDVVIEVCGDKEVFQTALNLLRPGGVYILIGLSGKEAELSLPVDILIKKCLTVRGCQGYTSSDLRQAIEFLELTRDQHPYEELLSGNFSIQDFHYAISAAKSQLFHRVALSPSMSRLRY